MYNKQCPEYLAAFTSDEITRAIKIVYTCIIIRLKKCLRYSAKSGLNIPKIKNLWLFRYDEAPSQRCDERRL